MALPADHNLFSIGVLINGHLHACTIERRYVPREIYHVAHCRGEQYTLRIHPDTGTFKFVDRDMPEDLRNYEEFISDKIFAYDEAL